ncbi:MAG: hypothetical protein QG625_2000 [Cyanobacteriota bacterium erpe_2018_sw_39hr_WHONDRS-SW48-000098_B_bin.30]|jgi:hypothetical protein|nr:hypothetical protein [Cyanobacteriota bacterium erpe_2018_sw_39hr_WHONDRS-SW48-000098_B_bin.30]
MTIDKDRVLRLNCPGYGEESHLNLGQAKSLEHYQVIIANPVSLLHLFDKGPEATRRINQFVQEGINQLNVPDDGLIQELINESDDRLEQLIPFLSQGGLLIYFLCRPFILAGPSISVDNYDWLSVYAPAQKNAEGTGRQMSAVSHGRVIEPSDEGENSEMAEYFKQSGLEWNTIIRTDVLSSNYSVLATAGPKKCIAAQFWAGDNGGKVIFLPAPYSPDFDKALMNGVDIWYQEAVKQGHIKVATSQNAETGNELAKLLATATDSLKSLDTNFASTTTPSMTGQEPVTESNINQIASEPPAPKAESKPPKGALKSLFDDDGLDDDDFGSPAKAAVQPVSVTAEDILKSVSLEAERLSKELEAPPAPEAIPSMADLDLDLDLDNIIRASVELSQSEELNQPYIETASEPVQEEAPQVVEKPHSVLDSFELKRATADMDLSEFAETARQLVQQANEIETATREPGKAGAITPKQKITDLLKGLEESEATPIAQIEEITDVTSEPVIEERSPFARPEPTAAEIDHNDALNEMVQNLRSDPTRSGDTIQSVTTTFETTTPPRPDKPATAMSMDEFRSTFDFLKPDEEVAAVSEQPIEAVTDNQIENTESSHSEAAEATFDAHDTFVQAQMAARNAQKEESAAVDSAEKSSLRAIMNSINTPQVAKEPPTPAAVPAWLAASQSSPSYSATPAQKSQNDDINQFDETQTQESMPSLDVAKEILQPSYQAEILESQELIDQIHNVPAPTNTLLESLTAQFEEAAAAPEPEPVVEPEPVAEPEPLATNSGQWQKLAPPAPPAVTEPEAPVIEPPAAPASFVPAPQPAAPVFTAQAIETPMPEQVKEQEVKEQVITPPAPQVVQTLSQTLAQAAPPPPPVREAAPTQAPFFMEPKPAPAPVPTFTPQAAQIPVPAPAVAPENVPAQPPKFESPPQTNHANNPAYLDQDLLTDSQSLSAAKDLMTKMEELTQTMNVTWTNEFSFPYVDGLKSEHGQMMEQLRQMQLRLGALDSRIRAVEGLKHVLLTGENEGYLSASQEVLTRLGWTVTPSRSNPTELWLSRGDQIDAIARIVRSPATANRSEIAQLAESVIAFWDEYEIEPKGILIAQTWFSKPPTERTEPDFTPALQEFAGKKNLCLMSSIQLLAMYKDMEMSNSPVEETRKRMLETNGRLMGFSLDNSVSTPA